MALTKAHNRMIEGAYVNVKDFGATGDGSTDDTSAVQAAIDAAVLGGVVYFPKGEYVVSSLTAGGPNKRFLGTNSGNSSNQTSGSLFSSTIRFTETTSDAFTFSDAGFFSKNVVFENLGFQANTAGAVLSFDTYGEVRMNDCLVNNLGTGDGVSLNEVYLISFSDCFITKTGNIRQSGSAGVRIDNTGLGGIFNFFTSTVNQYDSGVLIDALYNDGTQLESFNFIGSQANSNTIGLGLSGFLRSGTISGCYFEGNILASIQMIQGVQNFAIQGCFFNDPGSTTAELRIGRAAIANDQNVRNISVEACHFSNINNVGIEVRADPAFGGNILVKNCNFNEYTSSTNTTVGIQLLSDYVAVIEDCNFDTLDIDIQNPESAKRIESSDVYHAAHKTDSISATLQLTADMPRIITITPTGANRDVELPAIADAIGKEFLISCATGASHSVVIKNSTGGTTYATIAAGESALCWNDGTEQFVYAL